MTKDVDRWLKWKARIWQGSFCNRSGNVQELYCLTGHFLLSVESIKLPVTVPFGKLADGLSENYICQPSDPHSTYFCIG